MKNLRLYIKDFLYHVFQRRIMNFPVAILMYHSIGDNNHFFTVKTEMFRRQMQYLKNKGYNVLRLAEVVDNLIAGKKLAPKSVVLTFDDGYEDNLINALPILKEFNFPATLFVSVNLLGTEKTVRGTSIRHLTRGQIIRMRDSGLIDVQPHGLTHRRFSELPAEEAEKEMAESQSALAELIGSPRKLFAYPYGALNYDVLRTAQNLFTGAVGVHRGYVSARSNIMDLERQSIDSLVTMGRFKLKI